MPPNLTHHRLGDLQLDILKVLWDRTEASVSEIHDQLHRRRKLAYTTVATMLRKMEARELVSHREEGRAFIYRAGITSDEVSRSVGDHLVKRLFEGSLTGAVSHLLRSRDVSREELDRLAKLIQETKRRTK
jgi:BlaI family transcriptional regulator, penicillinase repressor